MGKIQATLIALLVVAVGSFAFVPGALAMHGDGAPQGPNAWHSDVATINHTESLGINGPDFVPAWVKTDCDTPVDNGWHHVNKTLGTGCHAFAEEALSQWLLGGWWDPRGGTEFIPPSGDHHRAHARTSLQAHFSFGSWLAGFAALSESFPWYPLFDSGNPQVPGNPGPGETPVGTYELCSDADGAAIGGSDPAFDTDVNDMGGATDGSDVTTGYDLGVIGDYDGSTAVDASDAEAYIGDCRKAARRAGALLAMFLDHHGEPLTPGRFPRYIPQERQAWVSTLVTKYTASPELNVDFANDTDNNGDTVIDENDLISDLDHANADQVFRTQVRFWGDSADDGPVTWFNMSAADEEGCPGGWCQYWYDPETGTLIKLTSMGNGVSPGAPATFFEATTALAGDADREVTTYVFINDFPGVLPAGKDLSGGDCDPGETCIRGLGVVEKAPAEIYQTIGQWVDLRKGPPGNPSTTENQAFWQEFWQISGIDNDAREGINPNTWVVCSGDGSGGYASAEECAPALVEDNDAIGGNDDGVCDAGETCVVAGGGGIDSVQVDIEDLSDPGNGDGICDVGETCVTTTLQWAIVQGPGTGRQENGLDIIARYGTDLRPGPDTDGNCDATGQGGCLAADPDVMVICLPDGFTAGDLGLTGAYATAASSCTTDAGGDGVLGTADDGTIYYREAIENGLRGYIRENQEKLFAFNNGLEENFGGASCSQGFFGGCANIRQAVAQSLDVGMTVSLFNGDIETHPVPTHAVPRYDFDWPGTIGVAFRSHDEVIGLGDFENGGDTLSIP